MAGSVPNCGAANVKRIRVKLRIDKSGAVWGFTIKADDKASGPYVQPNDVIELPNPTPQSEIEFRLYQTGGKKLEFDQSDPVWIKANSCPTQACNVGNEVCIVECTENRLRLLDQNSAAATYYYRLNFVDKDNNPITYWDPIIRNGGGGP
jgi:hypothetical protein